MTSVQESDRGGDERVVPPPDEREVLLDLPTEEESRTTARAIAWAASDDGVLTPLQDTLLRSLFLAMTGTEVDLRDLRPVAPVELAEHLRRRSIEFRTRGVQVMLLTALVLRPLPVAVVDRITRFAHALAVDDSMISVARRFAAGSLGLAAFDFERNGYTSTWNADAAAVLHTSSELASAWDASVDDPALAGRWEALEHLPPATLGRRVWELYQARGFDFPGRPGSAPPLLAQHDWVHVLADYGTTVESELEVFGFIARANDDMRAFSLLAMVVSLFETGYLRTGAGLFEADTGHLSSDDRVAVRLADAMRRGALCHDTETGEHSIDFLRLDWFSLAEQSLDDVRRRFSVTPKSDAARLAGSVGPWERGGISPYQARSGERKALAAGRAYDAFGAGL